MNGNRSDSISWNNFARIKKMKMQVQGKNYAYIFLHNSPQAQLVSFNKSIPLKDTIKIEFEILEVYQGKKYQNTCVSEFHLDGTGGHSGWGELEKLR